MSLLYSPPLLRLRLGKPATSVRSYGFSSSSLVHTPPCSIMVARPCAKLEVSYANEDKSIVLEKKVPVEDAVITAGSSSLLQTSPCSIIDAVPCGAGLGKLQVLYPNEDKSIVLEKKVPMELVCGDAAITVGSSNGWVATLREDGILRLQDDLNPVASDTDPKRIPLPPLVTLPRCQTQIVTNIAMSSPSPEDEDCVVAIKFLGPQLSFCRPAQSNSEWTNIRLENPSFFSSPVMYSKKDSMFRIPGSGGYLIGSWDPRTHEKKPQFQTLRFQNLPKLTKTQRELLHSCCTTDHLVESRPTGETFLVKRYRSMPSDTENKLFFPRTRAVMVFKLDAKGNAVYTSDIGDLSIFISKSEPFCVLASSFDKRRRNSVNIFDVHDSQLVYLEDKILADDQDPFVFLDGPYWLYGAPYHIPPQNRDL